MDIKIFTAVHTVILVFNIVASYSINNQNEEEPRIPKRHSKSKSIKKEKHVNTIINDELETNVRTTELPYQNGRNGDDRDNPNSEQYLPHNLEDDVSRTGSSDGTNTEINIYHNNNSNDNDDFENSRSQDHSADFQESSEKIEGFGHLAVTPSYADSHQDVMLDIKARMGEPFGFSEGRSGFIEPEDNLAHRKPDIRTNFAIPEDYVDTILRPHEYRMDNNYNQRFNLDYNNDMMNQFYNTNTKRVMYKDLYHPAPRYNPSSFLNRFNSREIVYPKPYSLEPNWAQNNGQYINIPPHVRNIPTYTSFDSCPTCQQNMFFTSHEDTRRSAERPYITANGRSLESEPFGYNSYPYVARQDENSPTGTLGQQPLILQSDAPSKTGQQADLATKSQEPLSKNIIQKTSPMVINRRIGLTGYHIISGY